MTSDQFEIGEILYPEDQADGRGFLDKPIYRFMSFEALEGILLSGFLSLVKTTHWKDPYENFLFKPGVIAGETSLNLTSNLSKIFGSCWTKKQESDALWRIYSQNKCGVSVRSSIGKLAHCLQQQFKRSRVWSASIGEVCYRPLADIQGYFNAFSEDDFVSNPGKFYRDSMFFKRREFEHEEEVRIILFVKKSASIQSEIVPLPIPPKEVIEEITFDPRINDDLYNLFVSKLKLIGFEAISSKSRLYSVDGLEIRFAPSNTRFEIVG